MDKDEHRLKDKIKSIENAKDLNKTIPSYNYVKDDYAKNKEEEFKELCRESLLEKHPDKTEKEIKELYSKASQSKNTQKIGK